MLLRAAANDLSTGICLKRGLAKLAMNSSAAIASAETVGIFSSAFTRFFGCAISKLSFLLAVVAEALIASTRDPVNGIAEPGAADAKRIFGATTLDFLSRISSDFTDGVAAAFFC